MKKILLVHHSGHLGGAGLSFLHLVESISKKKFCIEIICPKHPNYMSSLLKEKGFNVIELEDSPKIFPHYNGGIKYGFSPRTFKNIIDICIDKNEMKRIIEKSNPDILIVNSMTLFWIGKIAKKLNIATICFHRESYIRGLIGLRTFIIKRGLSNWFDEIVFISKYDFKKTGVTKAKKSIIYDKVDTSLYEVNDFNKIKDELSLDNNTNYILYLGGISKLKGSHVILKAMKYLKNENIKLLFVSELNSLKSTKPNSLANFKTILQVKKINKLIQKNNIKTNVILLDKILTPEVYYHLSDLVVFPSTLAHQARPIYEAGIAKKPIIVTDFENTKEFTHKRTLTFHNKNSLDLANKIKTIINTDIKNGLIEKNYKSSLEKHNLNDMRKEMKDLLEEFYR